MTDEDLHVLHAEADAAVILAEHAHAAVKALEGAIARDTDRLAASKAALTEAKAAAKVADKVADTAALAAADADTAAAAAVPEGTVVARAGAASASGA